MNDVDRFAFFVGIDWGSEAHQVCVLNAQGEPLGQRQVSHTAGALEELFGWLEKLTEGVLVSLAVAIEVPRGPLVETLLERGLTVFSLNPKQLDRFRDRYFPAGAKDDRRDAFVLASSLRTDRACFRRVRRDDPCIVRLRARGHSHGRALRGVADRLLAVLCAMLRSGTLFDASLRHRALRSAA